MTPSTFSGLRVVLFPYVAGPFVLLEYIVDDVRSQLGVDPFGSFLVWSPNGGIPLFMACEEMRATSMEEYATYSMKCAESHVVHWHPDGSFPVVFALSEFRMRQGKTADTVWGP